MVKPLIIYYSRAGENWVSGGVKSIPKGNTEIVAEKIQMILDADIFKIEPAVDYGKKYRDCVDRASEEWKKNLRPEVKSYPEQIRDAKDVVICYPNWCGTLPMFMFTILDKCDLSGKNIYPLCTNEGSGMGHSENDLKRYCENAKLFPGLSLTGSKVSTSDPQIEKWLGDCGLI